MPRLFLPKTAKDRVEAVSRAMEAGESVQRMQRAKWWAAYEYMRGNRNFEDINMRDGIVRVNIDDQTAFDFRYEETQTKFNDEAGKLLQMDTRPKVNRRKMSLDHLRKASVAQIVMDNVIDHTTDVNTRLRFIPMLVRYGTAALVAWVEPMLKFDPTEDAALPSIEVVPPWELIPIPAESKSPEEVTAIVRQRWVSMKWMKSLEFGKKLEANRSKIRTKIRKFGQPPGGSSQSTPITTIGGPEAGGSYRKPKETEEEYVKVRELWSEGRGGRLAGYGIYVDDIELQWVDYTERPDSPYMPVGVARYNDSGGFFGRSLPEMLMPLNARMEEAIRQTYDNIENFDIHGTTFYPASFGIPPSSFEGSDVPRLVPYEPDYTVPQHVPTRLAPSPLHDLPARVGEFSAGLMDRLVPPNIMSDKGRVDSARGLGFLQERANIPLTFPSMSIASAYATVYRALLDRMRRLWPATAVTVRSHLDDALAGVTLDMNTGKLDPTNEIPKANEVEIAIVSSTPISIEQKRRDLYDMKNGGVIDDRWFRIKSREEGLGLPVANDAEWENYRSAMLNNIILFGDGKTPGEGAMIAEHDLHELHLEVMDAFMARPEFKLSSPQVRERFQEARRTRMSMMANFPEGLDYPEQEAGIAAGQGPPGLSMGPRAQVGG